MSILRRAYDPTICGGPTDGYDLVWRDANHAYVPEALDANLIGIEALTGNGMVAKTGAGTFATWTIAASNGLVITNGDGVAAAPTIGTACAQLRERTFRPLYPRTGTLVFIADTAYFVFLGQVPACTPKYVEFVHTANGSGAQTAEVGFFSSPTAPSKAGQTLTKIVATGTVDSLTSGAGTVGRNTNAFATAVAAGTYLWAGMRTNMAVSQPTFQAIDSDMGHGHLLSTTTAGALTASGSFVGALTSGASACPLLVGVLD